MRELRHSRLTSMLALVALALQFALSFGHTHADALQHPHASWPLIVCQHGSQHACTPTPHDKNQESCPICFAAALLETSVASAPLIVTISLDLVDKRMPVIAVAARRLQTAFMFQARGPPRSA